MLVLVVMCKATILNTFQLVLPLLVLLLFHSNHFFAASLLRRCLNSRCFKNRRHVRWHFKRQLAWSEALLAVAVVVVVMLVVLVEGGY